MHALIMVVIPLELLAVDFLFEESLRGVLTWLTIGTWKDITTLVLKEATVLKLSWLNLFATQIPVLRSVDIVIRGRYGECWWRLGPILQILTNRLMLLEHL